MYERNFKGVVVMWTRFTVKYRAIYSIARSRTWRLSKARRVYSISGTGQEVHLSSPERAISLRESPKSIIIGSMVLSVDDRCENRPLKTSGEGSSGSGRAIPASHQSAATAWTRARHATRRVYPRTPRPRFLNAEPGERPEPPSFARGRRGYISGFYAFD